MTAAVPRVVGSSSVMGRTAALSVVPRVVVVVVVVSGVVVVVPRVVVGGGCVVCGGVGEVRVVGGVVVANSISPVRPLRGSGRNWCTVPWGHYDIPPPSSEVSMSLEPSELSSGEGRSG